MSNMRDIGLLYAREMRSALRERNIVVNSILLPIFLYPLLLWLIYAGLSFVGGQTQNLTSRIALNNFPKEHQELKNSIVAEKKIELKEAASEQSIKDARLDLVAEFIPLDGNFRVKLVYDSSKDRSALARERVTTIINRYRSNYLINEAKKAGISPEQYQQFWVETQNIATSRQMGQFILGLLLPLFLVIMLAVGCMYPAIDSTAGEREKCTWETMMVCATPRRNIIIAKYLYVATMATMAAMLNVAALVVTMKSILAPILGPVGEGLSFAIPLFSYPLILLVTILLGMFVSAGMMILASFARTFKEGQSLVSPFYVAIFLPVMFLQSPDIEFTRQLALIPIVNVAMVFREAISGVYHWQLIGLTVLVEVVCVAIALWLAIRIIQYEDFLLGTYSGSFGKFIKQRVFKRSK
jgi:sodium transport system permease protein